MSIQIICAIYNYNEACLGPELSAAETSVLHALAYCSGPTGQIHPSVNLICQRSRLEKNTVHKAVARLKDIGLITVTPRFREDGSQTTSSYQITLPEEAYDLRLGREWARNARDAARQTPPETPDTPPSQKRTPPLPKSLHPPSQKRTTPPPKNAPPGNVKGNVRETTTTTTPTVSVAPHGGGGRDYTQEGKGNQPVALASRRLPVTEMASGECRLALPGDSPGAARWDWDEIAQSLEGDRARQAQVVADALREADAQPSTAHWRSELLEQMYRVRPKEPGKWAAAVVTNWRAGCGSPQPPAAQETGPDPASWEFYREAIRRDRERFAPEKVMNTGPTPDQLAFAAMFSRPAAPAGAPVQ